MKNFFKSAGFKLLAVVAAFLTGIFIYAAVRGDVATLPEQIAGAALRGKERTYEGLFEKHAV